MDKNSVYDSTYGTHEKVLSWTSKSLDKIHEEILKIHGICIGRAVIGRRLKELGYSLQANQKMLQVGESNPDRNAQFLLINKEVARLLNMVHQLSPLIQRRRKT